MEYDIILIAEDSACNYCCFEHDDIQYELMYRIGDDVHEAIRQFLRGYVNEFQRHV